MLTSAPEVEIAKKFLLDLVDALKEDTWREYTLDAYTRRPAPGEHRSDDIPDPITPRGAVDFIKDNIDAEQRNHLFNKPWLAKVVSRLSAEALAMLPGAADLVVDEEKSDVLRHFISLR